MFQQVVPPEAMSHLINTETMDINESFPPLQGTLNTTVLTNLTAEEKSHKEIEKRIMFKPPNKEIYIPENK